MLALLPQAIIDGVLLGGIYLTVAMGFSLAFGVLHIIDFAVGEWIMLGAFIGLVFTKWLRPGAPRGRPVLMGLVFTFGLARAFRGSALTVCGIFTRARNLVLCQGSWHFDWGPF